MLPTILFHLTQKFFKKLKNIQVYTLLSYLLFGFLFFHFAANMLVRKAGALYVGQVNLYGDLVFHLTLINKFLSSGKILPDNPIFAMDKINYPIFADFVTAQISKITGINLALFLTTFLMGILCIFTMRIFINNFIKNSKIFFLALLLFFLNGGFGFYYFIHDFLYSGENFWQFINSMPKEYTDLKDKGYWWINNYLAYFLPQRAFLFAFPVTLTTLGLLYLGVKKNRLYFFSLAAILAGVMPIIQIHSLLLLFILSACYFPMSVLASDKNQRKKLILNWLVFAALTSLISIPLFVSISSLNSSLKFINFHFGWVSKENIFWFWFKNLGLFAPFLIVSLVWVYKQSRRIFYIYVPFLIVFLICNLVIFQPWDFDNGKLLIYWYFASCILVAYFIYHQFLIDSFFKKTVGIIFIFFMIFASSLDIFRTFTNSTYYQIFSQEDQEVAQKIKDTTNPSDIFLTAQNHNNPIPALSGRSTLVGYTGWLWSHGVDFQARLNDVSEIYKGGPNAVSNIQKYKISYIAVGPVERQTYYINSDFFAKYPTIQLDQNWQIINVSNLWSDGNRKN